MKAPSYLLQMAGSPGTGKSALARVIGRRTGAVVLDKDVLKTAVLEAGIEEPLAGSIAYDVFFAFADHLLGQGWSVILDSPSYYEMIPAKGAAIAARRRVPYHFIECVCPDSEVLAERLGNRSRMPSQPDETDERETIAPKGAYLRVDTTQPLERCLVLALDYLGVSVADEDDRS